MKVSVFIVVQHSLEMFATSSNQVINFIEELPKKLGVNKEHVVKDACM